MKNKKLKRFFFWAGGTLLVLGIALLAFLEVFVAGQDKVEENICAGFERPGLLCIDTGTSNVFLVKLDAGGYLLIDTGFKHGEAVFRTELAKAGIKLTDINYLFLTHHHDDHAGFAQSILADSGAALILSEKTIAPIQAGTFNDETFYNLNPLIAFFSDYYAWRVKADRSFEPVTLPEETYIISSDDDELLYSLGIPGIILTTPGHTEDSISLLLDDGSLFVGDSAMNFAPDVAGIKHRPIFYTDMAAVLASWQKLSQTAATIVYPSHGLPFEFEEMVKVLNSLQE